MTTPNDSDRAKQPGSGSRKDGRQQQAPSGEGQQYGEGNYKATRDYDRGLKEHLRTHDVEREAREASPQSEEEAKEMEEAEREGRSKARGADRDDQSPGAPEDERDLTR